MSNESNKNTNVSNRVARKLSVLQKQLEAENKRRLREREESRGKNRGVEESRVRIDAYMKLLGR